MTGRLAGKVAFITGAARGQGRSHAVRFAEEGADIIAVDLCEQIATVAAPMSTKDDLDETAGLVEKAGGRIAAVVADVRDRAGLEAALARGERQLGRGVDIVVANAGIFPVGGPEPDPDRTFGDVLAVNLTGVWNTISATAPGLIERGRGGSIVLTSSTQGLVGRGGDGSAALTAYAASKHGVVGLMRSVANWLAPHQIRVNSVHPTGVNTPMIVNPFVAGHVANHPEAVAAVANALPVDMVEPVDVSNAILYLVSDEGRYVTGVTLPVDAGLNVH
ncbi:mycofactocin-coupled SDR family oxidoreductase [Amycolatopsis pithecellobii]|uniref:Mycofactocin-coupled SDR family oxidoreductase n=1 Tax=Amycolatopsis pithecellobii TaxID=664692 RepID=A0A6N7Z4Z4_9PSEU|nr:mycofactocin-coupled SDR family oxidoreductase [Amycolatopsis pithecellobii]MTD55534.1 mycofactocin-coupled SDR family oxidoreductase [Amycolatopsis pithecellobii]